MGKVKDVKVRIRDERFADKLKTRITKEIPISHNPYVAERCLWHGYDQLELMKKRSFVDVIFLLIKGHLPGKPQRELLEKLMIALCNPGPRHPATRAAMNAGVGKTNTAHILPIALSIMSGSYLGGGEVEQSMRFLRANLRKEPGTIATNLLAESAPPKEGDWHIAPGFGERFGTMEILPKRTVEFLQAMEGAGRFLKWGAAFAERLSDQGQGWLFPGVAAATFLDLGFHPRAGAGLFQLISAPGILAHGLELANKPITAMPFVDDNHYFIETQE